MAHFCPVCEYIYDHQRSNCPSCGGRVLSDQRPDKVLEEAGYVYAPVPNRTSNAGAPGPSNNIGRAGAEDNFFSQLWNDYQNEHTPTQQRSRSQDPTPTPDPSITPESHMPPRTSEAADSEADFFSQFDQEPSRDEIPEELPRDPDAERFEREQWENTAAVQEASRQARRARMNCRQAFRGVSIPPVPWGRIFRIAPVVCLIGFLIFLWQMRFAIAATIWELISALMPSIITIAAIIWLIRSIFRR